MTRLERNKLKRNKLNQLMSHIPHGVVLTLPWLKKQGISCKLAWWYAKSHWLERIGNEAYKKTGDTVTWMGALSAIQNQLQLPVHVGAKTALELLGQTHFIPLQGIKHVTLFNSSDAKIPRWFLDSKHWEIQLIINKATLFESESLDLGMMNKEIDGINIKLSSPERATLELLSLTPHKQSLDETAKLLESLNQLRPNVLQTLLEKCRSVKTKRLLLFFADKFQHPWATKLDLTKVDLGRGKRVIGQGGSFDPKYQISVPKIMEE